MEITFKGRHTSVPERFRRHASAKLAKLEKLDHNAIRIDVEVSTERNPRQADRSERVELTIRSRGPAIRAEAAADDRYAALDLAFIKLEGRLRKAAERRKTRRSDLTVRSTDALTAVAAAPAEASVIAAEAAALADVDIPAIPRPDDAAVLGARGGILHLGDALKDFSDTAAVVSALDLVISVDTSVAHLAGALGKPVWVLVPFAPDFRWLLAREDSPWYPTMRLFRQPRLGDWDSVLERVRDELRALAATR